MAARVYTLITLKPNIRIKLHLLDRKRMIFINLIEHSSSIDRILGQILTY